jgi:hypothetical protein
MSKSKSVYRGMRMPRRLGFGHVTVINQGLMWASLRRAKIGFWLTFVVVGIYTEVIAATLTGQTRSWLIGFTVGLAAGRTTSGTPGFRSGSTRACPPPRSRGGRGTESR